MTSGLLIEETLEVNLNLCFCRVAFCRVAVLCSMEDYRDVCVFPIQNPFEIHEEHVERFEVG